MLTIALAALGFEGRHGATAVERRHTRKFEVDVELVLEATAAERSDRLADTVDYSKVAEVIVGIGTGEPHRLLESLARRMVDGLRDTFPAVGRIAVALRKLNPPSCPGHPAYSEVRLVDDEARPAARAARSL
ncbi:MAG TPA: dihydroneopterin aldolase [Polyangia bacterium]|nr:dihydroneopterin aldolase [Polyangia bacterium]